MISRRIVRKLTNVAALGLSATATVAGLACLAAILWTLFKSGFAGISSELFTQMTPPPGADGGLLNAIYGSAVMTLLGILFGAPIGVLAGTYLAEYGRTARVSAVIRFINDILLSAPSIIIGLFVYEVLVVPMGHFSALAGAVALALIALPVTVRTTEDMLNLVPQGMKDASTALGAYPWRTITSVIYPAARSGIVTGLLLAVARISGETAPLLFTALNNQFWCTNLECANGESAGRDLPVRAEPLPSMAAARLVGGAAHHAFDPGAEHHGALRGGAARSRGPTLMGAAAGWSSPCRRPRSAARTRSNTTCGTSISTTAWLRRLRTSISPSSDRRITAFIGPSGCGKSTLLRVFNRMYALYPGHRATGDVLLDGEDILAPSVDVAALRYRVGHGVPEADALPDVDLR